jgi:hypothetical protein
VRCTFLLLIGAMGNGMSHTCMLGSYSGMRPAGCGRRLPVKVARCAAMVARRRRHRTQGPNAKPRLFPNLYTDHR